MPAPFYNAIKGTTAGTPGTGAFTPNAAASGFRAWSTVPTGWIGLVRYEDGSAWELTYSYWNGTTLSRASTQLFDSSSGSAISLTSAATAAMVLDADDVQPPLGTTGYRGWIALINSSGASLSVGMSPLAVQGTAAAAALATTNFLTTQPRAQTNSATTANAQAGYAGAVSVALVSTTAGQGGFEWSARFGAAGLPTGPRLFAGMTSTTLVGSTAEPSAVVGHIAAFSLDSADTNIQLLTNSNAGGGTKIDTGIPLVANGWYEGHVWCEPGSNKVYGLLIRVDTGAIWLGSTVTDVPATGAAFFAQLLGSLNGTNTGTAFQMCMGQMFVRTAP